MASTKKLCAVVLSTLGREVMVRRPCVIGDDGWPAHPDPFNVTAGQVGETVIYLLIDCYITVRTVTACCTAVSWLVQALQDMQCGILIHATEPCGISCHSMAYA
jgi:hypothetical protein